MRRLPKWFFCLFKNGHNEFWCPDLFIEASMVSSREVPCPTNLTALSPSPNRQNFGFPKLGLRCNTNDLSTHFKQIFLLDFWLNTEWLIYWHYLRHYFQPDVTARISGWQRVKMGFKGSEREGRIELDQVEGREKVCKFKQFEIPTKVRKT